MSDSGGVPLALKGNVVGLLGGTDLDVVFDKELFGGTNLNHRCTPGRGARVKVEHVLNLSSPQPPHDHKNESLPLYLKYFLANPRQLSLATSPSDATAGAANPPSSSGGAPLNGHQGASRGRSQAQPKPKPAAAAAEKFQCPQAQPVKAKAPPVQQHETPEASKETPETQTETKEELGDQ